MINKQLIEKLHELNLINWYNLSIIDNRKLSLKRVKNDLGCIDMSRVFHRHIYDENFERIPVKDIQIYLLEHYYPVVKDNTITINII